MKVHSESRIAHLAAASVLLAAAELFIPKPLPFFRLGLANVPVIASLSMPFWDFFLLLLLKAVSTSYVSGNLFSPFLLLSLSQTIVSGLLMRVLNRIDRRYISVYGISAGGAMASAAVQLALASLYIGKAVWSYAVLMLAASVISSAFVAFISSRIDLTETPQITAGEDEKDKHDSAMIAMLIMTSIAVLSEKSLYAALISFALALCMQRTAKRRILLIPYLSIAFFMVLTSLFSAEGRILFEIGPLRAGTASLERALTKALSLSCAVAVSQSYTNAISFRGGIISLTMEYAAAMTDYFSNAEGSVIERICSTLSLKSLSAERKKRKTVSKGPLIGLSAAIIAVRLFSAFI